MRRIAFAVMLILLLVGMSIVSSNISPAKASATIYIRADGSVDPTTAPISSADNITYTLTGNINDSIVIERDNIVVDGAGYSVQGAGAGTGISLISRSNVTVKNLEVTNFDIGIYLLSSNNNTITGNNASSNNGVGIYLRSSNNNTISANNASNSYGIYLFSSNNNTITGNNFSSNNLKGIYLDLSGNNAIIGNTAVNNLGGIGLGSSNYNTISANNFSSNSDNGIHLFSSNNNTITGNNASSNNLIGIYLYLSGNNTLSHNIASNERHGIYLAYASDNIVTNNTSSSNTYYGFYILLRSDNNMFYHNNFIDNSQQGYVSSDSLDNVWDDGYPSGGNYWSDYTGLDEKSGPNQNQLGSDGIGDTPYVINGNNTDTYPLMGPFGPLTMKGENVTVFPTDDVALIFGNVTSEGFTTVNKTETGPEPPSGFRVEQYYDIETTASYSGNITIRIIYDDSNMTQLEEESLQLMQYVTLPGDVDDDGDVDIFDIVKIAGAYGSKEGDPEYIVICDIDGDGDVDIFDVVMAVGNYGQSLEPTQRWLDITTYIDTENNLIIGETSHLSIFGVTSSS